jgi:hypothetical protein
MSYGPTRKVLSEVASTIAAAESGEITLTWSTAHGRRVVEVTSPTIRVEPARAAPQSPEREQRQSAKASSKKAAQSKQEHAEQRTASEAVRDAFVDAWLTVFPPRSNRDGDPR